MNNVLIEKRLHLTFEISIILKGLHAFLEIVSGFLFLITSQKTILSLINYFTREEAYEDPHDFMLQFIIKTAGHLSVSGQHFISLYLISHGIIKLFVVIILFKKKLWAYPVSLVVFSSFIIYQLYRYTFTHSPWLLLFTLFDVFVILLTLHEYTLVTSGKALKW